MKNRHFEILFGFVLLAGFLVFSCKKKAEETKPEVTTNVKSIQKEEPPRSKKKLGEFDAGSDKVAMPSAFNNENSPEATSNLAILTSNSSSNARIVNSANLIGWTLSSLNNQNTNNTALYFFKTNGVYYTYEYTAKKWNWGFYYINKTATLLVLDPETTFEKNWKITSLSSTKMYISSSVDKLEFMPFIIPNTEMETYSQSEIFSLLKDRDWLYSSYNNGQLNKCQLNKSIKRVFYENGTYVDFNNSTPYDTNTWVIQNAKLILGSKSYSIDYFYANDFGLSESSSANTNNELYCLNGESFNSYYKTELLDIENGACCDPCSRYSGCYNLIKCNWNTYNCEVCNVNSENYNRDACATYGQNCP